MKNRRIFIDTCAYLSRFHKRDQYHSQSLETWEWISHNGYFAVTTNHVIDEVATLLGRRTSYDFATQKLQEIYESEAPLIIRPEQIEEKAAVRIFLKYADQKISFTDCLSFVIMRQWKIMTAFSFDKHFRIAGFETIPPLP